MSVTSGNNDGPGSLRQAILMANANDAVELDHAFKGPIILDTPIMIPKNLTIVSYTEAIITVSDRFEYPYAIICGTGTRVTFMGFSFRGNINNPGPYAILSEGAAHNDKTALTLIFCSVQGWVGTSHDAAPITVRQSSMYLNETEIRDNTGTIAGVYQTFPVSTGSFDSIITRCQFISNVGTHVSSCLVDGQATVRYTLADTVVKNNLASDGTAGISYSLPNGSGDIVKCTFENNDIDTGVCSLTCTGSVIMKGCTFFQNRIASTGHTVSFDGDSTVTETSFETGKILATGTRFLMSSCSVSYGGLVAQCPIDITNCTFIYNDIALTVNQGVIRSTTIVKNEIGIDSKAPRTVSLNNEKGLILYNTIVGLNNTDINGYAIGSHNLISVGSFRILMFNSLVGTLTKPIDPDIGMFGDYGGNGIKTVPLLLGSPALNAGSNDYVTTEYDQRGAPHLRIQTKTDIGAFEATFMSIACYLGSSKVKVRTKANGHISVIPASKVYAEHHEVYDVLTEKFVPVVYNAVIRGATRIYKIPKNMFGDNQPFEDFFLTSGHPIRVYNTAIKARDLEGATRLKINSTEVYSIVTENWQPIEINGIAVYAWSKADWLAFIRKTGMGWVDNCRNNG